MNTPTGARNKIWFKKKDQEKITMNTIHIPSTQSICPRHNPYVWKWNTSLKDWGFFQEKLLRGMQRKLSSDMITRCRMCTFNNYSTISETLNKLTLQTLFDVGYIRGKTTRRRVFLTSCHILYPHSYRLLGRNMHALIL